MIFAPTSPKPLNRFALRLSYMKIFDSFISILSNSYGLAISQFAAVFHYFCFFFSAGPHVATVDASLRNSHNRCVFGELDIKLFISIYSKCRPISETKTQMSLTNHATHLCKCSGVADLLKHFFSSVTWLVYNGSSRIRTSREEPVH